MFVVQISLLIVTFLSLISRILSLMQTTKEVYPHPCIAPCVNVWSATFFFFFFLCHLLIVGACICHIAWEGQVKWTTPHHTIKMLHIVLFHSVTCYTNFIVSRIPVSSTKHHNIMCTLVATGVIIRSLECNRLGLEILRYRLIMPKNLPRHWHVVSKFWQVLRHVPFTCSGALVSKARLTVVRMTAPFYYLLPVYLETKVDFKVVLLIASFNFICLHTFLGLFWLVLFLLFVKYEAIYCGWGVTQRVSRRVVSKFILYARNGNSNFQE